MYKDKLNASQVYSIVNFDQLSYSLKRFSSKYIILIQTWLTDT